MRTTWSGAEGLDAQKHLPTLGSEGDASCWDCFNVFSKLKAMLGKKLLIFQARRSLGSAPEALFQSTVWQVFEGLSGKSDSKEQSVTGAIVIVHIAEGTTCGQGPEDTAKPQQKWYRSRADCQFLGNIQRA